MKGQRPALPRPPRSSSICDSAPLTPATARASRGARYRSSIDQTWPASSTLPRSTGTSMWRANSCGSASRAASTRAASALSAARSTAVRGGACARPPATHASRNGNSERDTDRCARIPSRRPTRRGRRRSASATGVRLLGALAQPGERGWQVLAQRACDQEVRDPEARIEVHLVLDDGR